MASPLHPDLRRVVEKQLTSLDGRVSQCLKAVVEHRDGLAEWEQKLSDATAERDVLTGILQGRVSPLLFEPKP